MFNKSKVHLISIGPKKPCLSLVRLHSTDIPPTQQIPAQFPRSLKDVSLRSQPPPQSSKLPTQQTYCTSCHKILKVKMMKYATKQPNMAVRIATCLEACCRNLSN